LQLLSAADDGKMVPEYYDEKLGIFNQSRDILLIKKSIETSWSSV